jgi:hypothetical protein
MDKQIYLDVSARLLAKVPELQWIDYDWGQLNDESPAIAYPCALIDISFPDCKTLAEGPEATEQLVNATITIKLAFQPFGDSRAGINADVQNIGLKPLDTVALVHKKLQAWGGNGTFAGLSRRRAGSTPRRDRLKVYTIIYETTFINEPD